jgi:Uncharacterized protein conserved in bacteria (DUF2188)
MKYHVTFDKDFYDWKIKYQGAQRASGASDTKQGAIYHTEKRRINSN